MCENRERMPVFRESVCGERLCGCILKTVRAIPSAELTLPLAALCPRVLPPNTAIREPKLEIGGKVATSPWPRGAVRRWSGRPANGAGLSVLHMPFATVPGVGAEGLVAAVASTVRLMWLASLLAPPHDLSGKEKGGDAVPAIAVQISRSWCVLRIGVSSCPPTETRESGTNGCVNGDFCKIRELAAGKSVTCIDA